MRASILIVWIVFGLTTTISIGEGPVKDIARYVTTESGLVKGYKAADGEYIAFLGIPYAAPPTGDNRFKAPRPPEPWNYTLEATRTVICPQKGKGDEDCLILNVFTPINIEKPLPVLFYIHGGSFLMGYGPTKGLEPLMKQDIIVVTINYRLGVLGFLSLGIEEAPGNAGLKDQVLALQWVQKNIAKFGGNPEEVTVYGMSAGAASAEILIMSPMSKGLYKRAVLESGAATAVWVIDPQPILTASAVAKLLNYKIIDNKVGHKDLAQFYKNVPADKLSKINDYYYDFLIDGTFGFVPCVEKRLKNVQPILTEPPYEILVSGKYEKVPLMVVFATMEGLYLRSEEYLRGYPERMHHNFTNFLPADLIFRESNDKKLTSDTIYKFYFGHGRIDNVIDYLNYFGDYLIMAPLLNSTEMHLRGGNPVYLMEFGYKGNMGTYEAKFHNDIDVAGHGDFIKHAILARDIESHGDNITVKRVSKLIGNFVKYGNPTPTNDQLLPVPWPRATPGDLTYLALEKQFEVRERPIWKRRLFWDDLYAHYRRKIRAVGSKCRCGCFHGCDADLFICNKGKRT